MTFPEEASTRHNVIQLLPKNCNFTELNMVAVFGVVSHCFLDHLGDSFFVNNSGWLLEGYDDNQVMVCRQQGCFVGGYAYVVGSPFLCNGVIFSRQSETRDNSLSAS